MELHTGVELLLKTREQFFFQELKINFLSLPVLAFKQLNMQP